MSLRDVFLKRGHESSHKKKHYSNKDADYKVPWRAKLGLEGTLPPMIQYPDGSVGSEPKALAKFEDKYAKLDRAPRYHPVGGQGGGAQGQDINVQSGFQGPSTDYGPRKKHDNDHDFDYDARGSVHAQPSGLSMHFPVQPGPAFYHSGQDSRWGPSMHFKDNSGPPSYHSEQGSYHGQPQFGVPSMPRPGSVWSQQADAFGRGRVSEHDWANPAVDYSAPLAQYQSQHHQPSQPNFQHQAPPLRTRKVREGDPIPTGLVDPLAIVSPNHPLGHHGMRQHVVGMSKLNPERHGKADDPMANFKVLEELAWLNDGQAKKSRKMGH